jgi:hypothetical protein
MLGEGRIERIGEDGSDLVLVGEEGRTAILRMAVPGSSVIVRSSNGEVEYSG